MKSTKLLTYKMLSYRTLSIHQKINARGWVMRQNVSPDWHCGAYDLLRCYAPDIIDWVSVSPFFFFDYELPF
jgi:hypothetical protein